MDPRTPTDFQNWRSFEPVWSIRNPTNIIILSCQNKTIRSHNEILHSLPIQRPPSGFKPKYYSSNYFRLTFFNVNAFYPLQKFQMNIQQKLTKVLGWNYLNYLNLHLVELSDMHQLQSNNIFVIQSNNMHQLH